MKKMKVSILALSVLVGGAVFASAAEKLIVANTTDIVVTNAAPLVWSSVSDIPTSVFANTTNLAPESIVIVDTDSKGKIYGVVNGVKNWPGGSNSIIAQSSWIGDVKGSIKASKMAQPTIQMTIKANGYSSPTTNALVIGKSSSSAGNASLNINFKSTAAPVPVGTNEIGQVTWKAVGTSKINFKPGITVIQSSKTVTESADLLVDLTSLRELPMRVVNFGSKFGVIAGDMFGTGSVNSKNQFTVNLKDGTGGSNIQLKGNVAAFAFIGDGTTNQIVTISTVAEKGKIQGQAVTGNGVFSRFD